MLLKATMRVGFIYIAGWCATFDALALLLMIVAKGLYNPDVAQNYSSSLGGLALSMSAKFSQLPVFLDAHWSTFDTLWPYLPEPTYPASGLVFFSPAGLAVVVLFLFACLCFYASRTHAADAAAVDTERRRDRMRGYRSKSVIQEFRGVIVGGNLEAIQNASDVQPIPSSPVESAFSKLFMGVATSVCATTVVMLLGLHT